MKNFAVYRKLTQVFHKYGINLLGKRKYDDLKMDPVYVNGLIFELELESQLQYTDEDINRMQQPIQIIQRLMRGR